MLSQIQEILVIIVLLLGIVGTVAGWFNSSKARKIAETANKLKAEVEKFVPIAEQLGTLKGAEKKAYVLAKVEEVANEKGFVFDAEEAGKLIEDLLAITKVVNVEVKKPIKPKIIRE